MNIIHRLQLDKAELMAERDALLRGIGELRRYLLSDKFDSERGELAGYVNVKDVLLRLEETKSAAIDAGGEGREAERAEQVKRRHPVVVAQAARDEAAMNLNS